mgnify:CR=1 FL=1
MSRTRISTVACPRCGKSLELRPHPERAGRMIADCECNLGALGEYRGPVIETNADAPIAREEVTNDSTIS